MCQPIFGLKFLPNFSAGYDETYRLCSFPLCSYGDVSVGAQSKPCTVVPQHPRDRLDGHTVLQGHRGAYVPLRHIYDNTKESSDCNGFKDFSLHFGLKSGSKKRRNMP